jgi:hypothetical protein
MASKVEAVIIVINEGKSKKTMEEAKTIAESRMFHLFHVNVANKVSITSRLVGNNIRWFCLWVWLISINQLGRRRKANYPMPILQDDVPGGTRKKGRRLRAFPR